MLEKERKVLIMEKLRQTGFVLVRDLMKEMNASRSSIMRDLISLEQEGMLVREHGGASLESVTKTMSRQNEPTVYEKQQSMQMKRKPSVRLLQNMYRMETASISILEQPQPVFFHI